MNDHPSTRVHRLPSPRAILIASALLAACGSMLSAPSAAYANNEVYRQLLRSSVWIVHDQATGSGVVVDLDKRWVLTNEHVVENESRVSVYFPAYKADNGFFAERIWYLERSDELAVEATVLLKDRDSDLALLQLDSIPEGTTAIEFASPAEPGDAVHSIGNPAASDALWVYTSGTVRANYHSVFRDESRRDMQVLETDAPINPGDSGGAVVNDDGKLVALVQSMRTDARLVSLCVDITEVERFLNREQELTVSVTSAWNEPVAELGARAEPFEFEYPVDGTTVTVMLSRQIEVYRELRVRRLWAIARPIDEDEAASEFAALLEENSMTKIGSWVLEASGSGEFNLIYCARLSPDLGEEEVRAAVDYVARMVESRRD